MIITKKPYLSEKHLSRTGLSKKYNLITVCL